MAYRVYNDAKSRGEDNPELWAVAGDVITFLTLFGGFLAIAVYIWQRE